MPRGQLFTDNILGLNLRGIEGNIDPRFAFDADGVMLTTLGGISKFPGRTIKVTGLDGSVTKLFPYDNSDGSKVYLAYADNGNTGTFYTWNAINGTKSTLGTVTSGSNIDIEQFEGKLMINGATFTPRLYDGSSLAVNADWVSGGYTNSVSATQENEAYTTGTPEFTPGSNPSLNAAHKNRPWYSGDADNPSKVFYGVLFTHSFDNNTGGVDKGGWLDINPLDGHGRIVGIKSWQDVLVVFKETRVYFIEGDGPRLLTDDPFRISQTVLPVGCNSKDSIVYVGNDIWFLDNNNYYRSLQNTIKDAKAETENLSYLVQPMLDTIPRKAQGIACSANYEKRNQVWLSHFKDYSEYTINGTNTRALYHLDTLNDETDNEYHLTNTGSTPTTIGFNNYLADAYHFDGSSQRLSYAGNLGTAFSQCTFRVWVNPDTLPANPGDKAYIMHLNHSTGCVDIYLENNAGVQQVVFSITDATGTERTARYNVSLPTGSWSWLALTWDGDTITGFVDGVSQATAACTSIQTIGTDGFALASSSASSNADLFDGKIDEVEVLDTELDSDNLATYFFNVTTKNNRVSVIDYDKKNIAWMKTTNVICPSSLMYCDGQLFSGTYDGEIHLQDDGNTQGLSRRESYYTTPWLDGGNPFANKRVPEIVVWLTSFGEGMLHVETSWDNRTGNIYPIKLAPDGDTTWGDDWTTELIWSSTIGRKLYKFRIRPTGHGRLFQLRFYGWEEAVPWTLVRYEVHWHDLGIR